MVCFFSCCMSYLTKRSHPLVLPYFLLFFFERLVTKDTDSQACWCHFCLIYLFTCLKASNLTQHFFNRKNWICWLSKKGPIEKGSLLWPLQRDAQNCFWKHSIYGIWVKNFALFSFTIHIHYHVNVDLF